MSVAFGKLAGFRGPILALGVMALSGIVLVAAFAFCLRSFFPPEGSVPALVRELADGRPQAAERRSKACFALSQMGPEASDAIPVLLRALDDPSPDVRISAVYALGKLGPAAVSTCPILVEELTQARSSMARAEQVKPMFPKDPEPMRVTRFMNLTKWREVLCEALIALAPTDPAVIGALVRSLDSPDLSLVAESCRILTFVGRQSDAPEPALLNLTHHSDQFIRISAICALAGRQRVSDAVIDSFTRGLADAEPEVRAAAVDALRQVGPRGARAVPALLQVLNEKGSSETEKLHSMIRAIQPTAAQSHTMFDSYPALGYSSLTRSGRPPRKNWPLYLERRTVQALAAMGPAASNALPRLTVLSKESSNLVSFEAAVAALNIGAPCEEVLPVLTSGVQSPSEEARTVALAELRRVWPRCSGALDGITLALRDTNVTLRLAALTTLDEMGTNALPAVSALEQACADSKLGVRETARRLLTRLKSGGSPPQKPRPRKAATGTPGG